MVLLCFQSWLVQLSTLAYLRSIVGIFDFADLMIPDAAVDVDIQEHSFEHGFSGDVYLFGPPISGEEVVNEFPDDWSPLPHRTGDATGSDVASLLGDGSSRALPGDSVVSGSLSGEPVTTQPVVSAEVHDAIFSRSLLTNCDVTGVTLPWETGIFREIFSDEPFADQLVPKMPISNLCNVSLGMTRNKWLQLSPVLPCWTQRTSFLQSVFQVGTTLTTMKCVSSSEMRQLENF